MAREGKVARPTEPSLTELDGRQLGSKLGGSAAIYVERNVKKPLQCSPVLIQR